MVHGLGKAIAKAAIILILATFFVASISFALAQILGMPNSSLTFILFGLGLFFLFVLLWFVGIFRLPLTDKLFDFVISDIKVTAQTVMLRPNENEWQRRRSLQVEFKKDIDLVSVLFVAADPTDVSRLRLGEEFREIHEKLKLAQLRDRFKLELPQLSVRPADISQALLDTQPQIVHFSGHGTATGALCFESQTGQAQLVQPDALAALFEQFTSQVSCVLLNACYSEIQAKAIAEHIEYVIGMNKAIGDKAAIAFTIGFYQALGAGRTVEGAYKLGCVQIRLQSIPEHLTPVLIKKGQQAAA